MNSEGGGIRSERGAIRVREGDGSWWAGPSRAPGKRRGRVDEADDDDDDDGVVVVILNE